MFDFLKKKKEEATEVHDGKYNVLGQTVLKKLKALKKQRYNQKLFDDFGWALKVYVSKRFHMNHEYTQEDLEKEIKKKKIHKEIKERMINLSSMVDEVKYGDITLNKQVFSDFVEEAEDLIKLTSVE